MVNSPSENTSRIEDGVAWKLTTFLISGLGAVSLALAVYLYQSGSADLTALEGKVDGLLLTVSSHEQAVKWLERLDGRVDTLSQMEKDVARISDRILTNERRIDKNEKGLYDEIQFCRETVLPIVMENRRDRSQEKRR